MSSLETRVTKLEAVFGVSSWSSLKPDDCTAEEWEAIGSLLRSLPDDYEHFNPHTDFANMLQCLGDCAQPGRLLDMPDAVIQASIQVKCDKLGQPHPTWLWRTDEAADEELRAEIDERREAVGDGPPPEYQS